MVKQSPRSRAGTGACPSVKASSSCSSTHVKWPVGRPRDDKGSCAFCKKTKDSPNPFTKGRSAANDTLPWYGDRACCAICRRYCTLNGLSAAKRQELTQAEAGSQTHNDFCRGREQYIEEVNDSEHGYVRSAVGSTTVEARQSSKVRGTTLIGVHWPSDVYKREFGHDVDKGKVYTYNGKAGIILGEEHGMKPGCTRLENIEEEAVDATTLVGDSRFDYATGSLASNLSSLQDFKLLLYVNTHPAHPSLAVLP